MKILLRFVFDMRLWFFKLFFWYFCRSLFVRKHRLNNLPRKPQPLKETFMLHFKASEAIFPLIWNTFGNFLYNLTYFLVFVRFVYFHQIDFDMFAALYVWLSTKIDKIFLKKSKHTIQPFRHLSTKVAWLDWKIFR